MKHPSGIDAKKAVKNKSQSPTGCMSHSGLQTLPAKRMVLEGLCWMKNKKGWSAVNFFGKTYIKVVIITPVAAAASVPFSLTSTNALWTTSDTVRSESGDMPVREESKKEIYLIDVRYFSPNQCFSPRATSNDPVSIFK